MKNEMKAMDVVNLNITGPVLVIKKFGTDYRDNLLCYWEGVDALIQLGCVWPHPPIPFSYGEVVEVEDEGDRIIESVEPIAFGPCIIRSFWLGDVGASKLGWAGFRYLTRKQ